MQDTTSGGSRIWPCGAWLWRMGVMIKYLNRKRGSEKEEKIDPRLFWLYYYWNLSFKRNRVRSEVKKKFCVWDITNHRSSAGKGEGGDQQVLNELPTDTWHLKVPQNRLLCPTHVDKKNRFSKKIFLNVLHDKLSENYSNIFYQQQTHCLLNLQTNSQDYWSSNWRIPLTSRTKHLARKYIRLRNVVTMYNMIYLTLHWPFLMNISKSS